MNNYIGTVKNGYMFTNKLSGISKDDIIYNYDKLGKKLCPFCEMMALDFGPREYYDYCCDNGHIFEEEELHYKPSINAKYRVVEVYDGEWYLDDLVAKGMKQPIFDIWIDSCKEYAIKCSLIEEVNMRLNDFVSWNKVKRYKQNVNWQVMGEDVYYCKDDLYFPTIENAWNSVKFWVESGAWDNYNDFLITRYNGLMKVIKIGDEK